MSQKGIPDGWDVCDEKNPAVGISHVDGWTVCSDNLLLLTMTTGQKFVLTGDPADEESRMVPYVPEEAS